MLKLIGKIPKTHFHLACSGGSDSMVILDFLMKNPKNKFDVIHFNHGTKYCDEAEKFIVSFCKKHNIECIVGKIGRQKTKDESNEMYWRDERYKFFSQFKSEPIITCHHLKDEIETWVMSSFKGESKIIPYYNEKYNIIRPFIITSKKDIDEWAKFHKVKYVVDQSNYDTSITRNFIRANIDFVYHINPGIEKTLIKKIKESVG